MQTWKMTRNIARSVTLLSLIGGSALLTGCSDSPTGTEPRGALRGTVISAVDSSPIAGARLEWNGRVTTSSRAGTYAFAEARARASLVRASAEGFQDYSRQVNGAGFDFTLTIVMTPAR